MTHVLFYAGQPYLFILMCCYLHKYDYVVADFCKVCLAAGYKAV